MSASTRGAPLRPGRRLRAPDSLPGLRPWFIAVLLFLYVPILVLIVYSFNVSNVIVLWQGFSLHWYRVTLEDPNVRRALANTVILAVSATAIAAPTATLAALAIVRGGGRLGKVSQAIIAMPLAVPEIVLAVATLLLFSVLRIHAGLLNLIVAHAAFCTPFAFLPIRAALAELDVTLEQAGRDLYCTPREVFRLVTMPLLGPGIVAGVLLSLVMSIDDFITSYMLAGAGTTTVPVYIFAMIRQGVTPQINALSTILLAASFALILLFWLVGRNRQ
jgi:spermidine/putrescine transport system permease protein